MTRYYKDVYGCRARIVERKDGTAFLHATTPGGHCIISRAYNSFKGARIALGRIGDGLFKEVSR